MLEFTVLPLPLAGAYNGDGSGILVNQHQHQYASQQQPSFVTNRNKFRPINLRDLFVAPPFDELDAVAMDGNGEPRRLTNTQLKSLRDRGYAFNSNQIYFYAKNELNSNRIL